MSLASSEFFAPRLATAMGPTLAHHVDQTPLQQGKKRLLLGALREASCFRLHFADYLLPRYEPQFLGMVLRITLAGSAAWRVYYRIPAARSGTPSRTPPKGVGACPRPASRPGRGPEAKKTSRFSRRNQGRRRSRGTTCILLAQRPALSQKTPQLARFGRCEHGHGRSWRNTRLLQDVFEALLTRFLEGPEEAGRGYIPVLFHLLLDAVLDLQLDEQLGPHGLVVARHSRSRKELATQGHSVPPVSQQEPCTATPARPTVTHRFSQQEPCTCHSSEDSQTHPT